MLKFTKDRGTPGYYPDKAKLRDGSSKWDIWAFMAMMCEADMRAGYYKTLDKEVDCVKVIRKHVMSEKCCPVLGRLLQHTILEKKYDDMWTLQEIKEEIARVKFQKQYGDKQEEIVEDQLMQGDGT